MWSNNVTWICTTCGDNRTVGAYPYATVPYPGYIMHNYTNLNQTEPWVIISKPHPDYMLMLWCGTNEVINYAGGILMSKGSKIYADMPQKLEDIFRAATAKFGVDYDKDMFVDDNSYCKDDGTLMDGYYIDKKGQVAFDASVVIQGK